MAKIAYKNVAFGNETTFGASIASTNYIHVKSLDINPDETKVLLDDTSNSVLGGRAFHKQRLVLEGSITYYAYPDSLKQSLELVTGVTGIGTDVGASAVSIAYAVSKGDYKSKTLRVDDGVEEEVYNGVRAKTWELKVAGDAEITQQLIGNGYGKGASISATTTASKPFTLGEFKVWRAGSYAELGTSTMVEIPSNEFTLTYDNQLEGMHQSGSRSIRRSDAGIPTLSLNLQTFYESTTHRDALYGCSVVAVRIEATVTNCQGLIAGVTPPTITIDIPEMQYTGKHERPYEAGQKIVATYNLEAQYATAQDALWLPKITVAK